MIDRSILCVNHYGSKGKMDKGKNLMKFEEEKKAREKKTKERIVENWKRTGKMDKMELPDSL